MTMLSAFAALLNPELASMERLQMTKEHMRELRRMRRYARKELAMVREENRLYPERRPVNAAYAFRLSQQIIRLVGMEQKLLLTLKKEAQELQSRCEEGMEGDEVCHSEQSEESFSTERDTSRQAAQDDGTGRDEGEAGELSGQVAQDDDTTDDSASVSVPERSPAAVNMPSPRSGRQKYNGYRRHNGRR
jgi:hypothetical protein